MYCVYITTYDGDKLPKYYVGSSSIEKVNNGYKGSVSSIEWKKIWNDEIINNPNYFKTKIISEHSTRKDALFAELEYQKKNEVVDSLEWVNKSFAQPNGFFGMDVSNEKNPMYGVNRTGEKHQGGENISKALRYLFDNTEKGLQMRKDRSENAKKNNPASNPETMKIIKETWKKTKRGIGENNGMFGQTSPMKNKKLYNNGAETKAFIEDTQPVGWTRGRHSHL
jgi:hypothetical protein